MHIVRISAQIYIVVVITTRTINFSFNKPIILTRQSVICLVTGCRRGLDGPLRLLMGFMAFSFIFTKLA